MCQNEKNVGSGRLLNMQNAAKYSLVILIYLPSIVELI